MPVQSWRASLKGPDGLVHLAEQTLLDSGSVVRSGAGVRLMDYQPASSTVARSAMEQVLQALAEADAEPPSVAELSGRLPGLDVPGLLRALSREGRVIAVGDRYYVTDALQRERLRLEDILRQLGPSSPAAIRERLGRSRKWLIPFLEWADREGVTVRDGDRRRLNLQAGS